jgi:hypothetical protein
MERLICQPSQRRRLRPYGNAARRNGNGARRDEIDPSKHHRRFIRLKGYDYAAPGAYFITLCVQNRECALGKIENGEMRLNAIGAMAQTEWQKLPQRFPGIPLTTHEYILGVRQLGWPPFSRKFWQRNYYGATPIGGG